MTRYVSAEHRDSDDYGQPLTKQAGEIIYDAQTKLGYWACMNEASYKVFGTGVLGLGHGQKYQRDSEGKLWKVDG